MKRTAEQNRELIKTRALKLVNPNRVREGEIIEAHFPNGEIEQGIAQLEPKPDYHCRYRRRMLLCEEGNIKQVITGCAGFPAGTKFYRVNIRKLSF